ncbi:uncharacterized protein LOC110995294 [Pieris rapae]|uniref:uncharacterized protein LOC110995294 n=1 Tax=Pieris rapae TaxID=64459 RepID=UPI001E27B356|nr:uncharacterized protein LOC110995294 [Pieris rapae]
MLYSYCLYIFLITTYYVEAPGLLLLYRPKDISDACVFSEHLRFDISFGMGMSDTITLVLRTLTEIDYACTVEVVVEPAVQLLVVVRYPNLVNINCEINRDAFILMKKHRCIRFCDVMNYESLPTHYFTFHVKERLRFKFVSNSSINADLNAHLYQVTVTSARKKPRRGCTLKNETSCTVGEDHFCFTSGVVCDGIKNCGVDDWFDERKSTCSLPIERLSYAPVIAVLAAMSCALLALGHIIQRCLPPLADSFFIFNANEDNRLCIDPVLIPQNNTPPEIPTLKRTSIIPVFSSSSEESSEIFEDKNFGMELRSIDVTEEDTSKTDIKPEEARISNIKTITERIQDTFKSFTFSKRRSSQKKQTTIV